MLTKTSPKYGPLKKSDLLYSYPLSPGGDDLTKRGEPDRSLLNRHEWYEMLYFVNWFAINYGSSNSNVAIRAERLIKLYLPGEIRSHDNVAKWLTLNWKNFP